MSGRTLVLAVLALSAAVLGWLFWARGEAMSKPIPAVALLPFESDAPYFSDGLTIELINSLAKVEKLRVASWSSVTPYRGKAGQLKLLKDRLQAAAVVEGTLHKQGDRVLVTVKLVDANSGEVIWSDSLDKPEREVFEIQERIAKGIIYALKVPLRMDPQRILVPVRTDSMAAYDSYLSARTALGTFSSVGLEKSAEFAQKAIAADPRFSPAYGLLAANYGLFQTLTGESLAKAKELAGKALTLDSSSPEAHEALGMALGYGDWDWKAAKLEFERAVQWAPNSSDAHAAFAAGYFLPIGDVEGAEVEARKAVELDARSFFANDVLAMVLQGSPAALGATQTAISICGDCPRLRRAVPMAVTFDAVTSALNRHDPQAVLLLMEPSLRKDARSAEALKRLKLRE